MTTAKRQTGFRLSPVAVDNLKAVTRRFGISQTAAVEVALALAAVVAVNGIAPDPAAVVAEFKRRAGGEE